MTKENPNPGDPTPDPPIVGEGDIDPCIRAKIYKIAQEQAGGKTWRITQWNEDYDVLGQPKPGTQQ